MPSINTIISNISNQNISLFFENKITSFKPEKDVFTNTINEETSYSDPIKIGHAELENHEELVVFSCMSNKELTERSAKKQQFEIAKKVLKEDFKDGAIFIFYDAQGNFRFSFIRRNYGQTGDKKFSTWKRYTYYVTPSESNRTFKERIDKCDYASLDSIQEAFSVEKLTKQFYNELFAWYQWALSDEIGITYPNNTNTPDDDRVKLEEQVIRLITRLLFVWFIKQKKLVPEYLFDTNELEKTLNDFESNSLENGTYYNAILQNLFFATLNKEISEREFAKNKDRDIKTRYRYEDMFNISEEEIIEYFKPIPFLNGGLFECLDKQDADGNSYFLDGFSRNPTKSANGNFRHRAFIPNCLFFDEEKGIIPLLRRYNFTVEENAPNEVQVALDPELLGKVFENLLGAFNPETKETARKQSGSFYTPREIVEYMVNESLINYLQTKLPNLDEKDLRDLFENETPKSTFLNDSKQCKDIADQLKAIKILDPACGSGAFPMGILSKMVEVLEKLGATNESIHDLKLHLIEECIYGIDIQTIATQISKLRFFITLVVEQDKIDLSKPDDNYGVLTLPNLETKFVSANTLIGIKAKPKQHNLFENPLIEDTKQELLSTRHEHFYAKTAGAKKRLREQDALLRDKLSKLLEENKDFAPDDALQLSQWNPYDQNTSSPFFDMEWMFGLQKGFDIVIGNPPYLSAVSMARDEKLKKYFKKQYPEATGSYDIYILFLLKALNFIVKDGNYCWIIPNKFLIADYASKTKNKLIANGLICSIDVSTFNVFESASVYPIIIIGNKNYVKGFEILLLDKYDDLEKRIFKKPEKLKEHNTFKDFGLKIKSGATGFEAQKLKKYIKDKPNKNAIPFTVSGGIDRFRYSNNSIRFMKLFFNEAYIIKGDDIADSKWDFWFKPKVVVAGMTKEIEAVYSENPLGLGVGSYGIYDLNGFNPYFITAMLNSKYLSYYINVKFKDKHLAGGYLAINKSTLERLPLVKPNKKIEMQLIKLSIEMHQLDIEDKRYNKIANQIDILVYKAFGLELNDIKKVDDMFSLNKEEYNNYKIES